MEILLTGGNLATLRPNESLKFDFEDYVKEKLGIGLKSAQTCKYFLRGMCPDGANCIYKHGKNEKAVVCKHWLRGLCKKGDACEFLHEYNLKKMPECWFFSKYGECSNPECQYLHIDPTSKGKECLWYSRGFCKHGPTCRNRHIRKVICKLYLTGFCPYGPLCEEAHPKHDSVMAVTSSSGGQQNASGAFATPSAGGFDHVTCYKCGQKGHYANRCSNRPSH